MTPRSPHPGTTQSSSLSRQVEVIRADGSVVAGRIELFNPNKPRFFLHRNDAARGETSEQIEIAEVKRIAFLRTAGDAQAASLHPTAKVVTVRLLDGDTLSGVTDATPAAGMRQGLFLTPTDREEIAAYERFYVPIAAVREIVSVRRLGEILTSEGLATPAMVQEALAHQEAKRKARLGEILVERRAIDDRQLAKGLALQAGAQGRKIGEILLEQGFISEQELAEALELQRRQRDRKLGEVMVELGFATYKMIGIALAMQYNVPFVDLTAQALDPRLRDLVPAEMAQRLGCLPLSVQQGILTVAVGDPSDSRAQDEARERTGMTVIVAVATLQDIARAIRRYYTEG